MSCWCSSPPRQANKLCELGRKSAAEVAEVAAQEANYDYLLAEQQNNLAMAWIKLREVMNCPQDLEFDIVETTSPVAGNTSVSVENVLEYEVIYNKTTGAVIAVDSLKKTFVGYSYDSASEENITIDNDSTKNVITLYYTANNYGYTVNYLEKDTNNPLGTSKTGEAVFGTEIVEKAIDIKGYNVEEGILTAVITEKENVINFYYKAGSFDYTVNYLESGTGNVLAAPKSAKANYGTDVSEVAVVIDGYTIDGPDNKSIKIDTENNVINFYYTINNYKYTVNYYKDGNLAHTYTNDATFGTTVNAEAIDYKGYKLNSEPLQSIVITSGENVIDFYYTINSYPYTVNYYKDGILAENYTDIADFGTEITATAKDYKGYTLISENTQKIEIDTENNVINFYYTVNGYGYTVNYLEKDSNKVLHPAKYASADFGTSVTENAVVIEGYTLDGADKQAITIDTENNVINFYYTVNSYDYTVNYLEKGTNKVLAESKSAEVAYGTNVTEDAVVIEGYTLDGADKQIIKIDKDNLVITFYYTVNSFDYTVNHYIEVNGSYNLYKTETDSAKFGTVINSADKNIVVNGYNFDKADVAKITIGADEGKNVINLYYSLKSVKYRVEHYLADSEGNYPASPAVKEEFYGKVGAVVEAQPIEIQYYTFDESMVADKKGTLTDSDKMLVLKLYYFFDTVGGNNGGDGIPDMYQKRVEFKVVNGRWPGTNQTIIVEYVTLAKDGKLDENGTAKVELPTDMIPFEGFEKGAWDVDADGYVVVSGTDTVRYTYTFDKIPVVEPENPDVGGEGDGDIDGDGTLEGDTKFAVIFGKTNAIGWYNVSLDGGETYQIVQGNSTLEVDIGTEIIVKASNPFDGSFTFYVNGDILDPNENGEIRVVVDGALLIGAWSIEIEDDIPEESLNWFQKIIKAIKDFFAKLFGKK